MGKKFNYNTLIEQSLERESGLNTMMGNTSPKENTIDITPEEELKLFEADIQKRVSPQARGLRPGFEIDKYSKYLGEVFNPTQDIDEKRAQAQSGWDKLKGFTGQLVIEATLGSLEGIGYALDFEEVFNAEKQAKEGFDNWFSSAIRGVKEDLQEDLFPVYQTHDALEGSLWERMNDSTFWAAQGKTFGITLSLMFPAVGVAGLASKAGKALRLANAGTAANTVLKGTSAALFSRKAESAMEAYGTFDQEYNKFLNEVNPTTGENYTDDEARTLAGQAASGVFKANAAMLPIDMMQYTLLLKPAAGLKKAVDAAKATKLGKAADYLFQIPSEAAEEAYQFVAAQESIGKVRNQTTPFGEGFGDRLSEYIKDPEFQVSAMLGGLMGGVFGGAGPVIRKIQDKYENFATSKAIAANLQDEHSLNKIDDNVEGSLIARAIKGDKIESLLQTASHLRDNINNKEFENPDEKKGYLDKINNLIKSAELVKQKDEELKSKSPLFAENPNVRKQYALDQYSINKYTQRLGEVATSINKTKSEFLPNDSRETAVGLNLELVSLRTVKNILQRDSSLSEEHKTNRIAEIDKKIEQKNIELESLLNSGVLPTGFDVKKYKTDATNKLFYDVFNRDKMIEAREALIARTTEVQNLSMEQAKEEENKINKDIEKNVKKAKREVVNEAVQESAAGGIETINSVVTDPVIGEDATKEATNLSKKEPVDYTQSVIQPETASDTKEQLPETGTLGTTKEKREKIMAERSARGEKTELNKIPETPQKYTINVADTNLPLAPTIPLESINWEASNIDKEDIGAVRLVESRGRNAYGILTGTVRLTSKDGLSSNAEVFFNDKKSQTIPTINTTIYENNDFSNVVDSKELASTINERVSELLDENNPEHIAVKEALRNALPNVKSMEDLNNFLSNLSSMNVQDVNGAPLNETITQAINDFFYNKNETSNSETVIEPLDLDERTPITPTKPIEPADTEGYVRGNIMEYAIDKDGEVDYTQQPYKEGEYALQDKPEESDGSKTDYDPEWINNPKNFTTGILNVEAFDSPYNQKVIEQYKDNPEKLAENLQLVGVHYDANGKRHTVTMLPSRRLSGMTDATYNNLKENREALAKEIIEYYKDPANKGTIFKSNVEMSAQKLSGKILRTEEAFNLTNDKGETPINPDLLPDGKIFLGVIREDSDGVYLHTPEFGDKTIHRNITDKVSLGDTFMWMYDGAGNLIPIRTFTSQYKKIKEQHPKIYQNDLGEIQELLSETDKEKNKEALTKLRDKHFHVYTRRTLDSKDKNKVKKVTFTKNLVTPYIKAYKDALRKRNSEEIKDAYNDIIKQGFTPSEVNQLLSGQESLRSQRAGTKNVMFTVEIGNTDSTNPNSVYSPEFEAFIQDMQHQVSVNQINKESKDPLDPKYNDVVGQFLSTNISPNRVSHSPVVRLKNIRRKEDVVTHVKQEKAPAQAEIDVIERERREELKGNVIEEVLVYKQVVRSKEFEVYEEKYDKNSNEFFRYVKREDGEITSTTLEEDIIFETETEKKEFIKDDTENWIDNELLNKINATYDAKLKALKETQLTPEERAGGVIPIEAFNLPESNVQNPDAGVEVTPTEQEVDEGKISAEPKTLQGLRAKIKGAKKQDPKPRRVDELLADKQKWDSSIEMKWLKKNLNLGEGGIEVEISEDLLNIGDGNAWGVFRSSMIEIWENAPKGTLFHEAFHAVFDMVLSDSKKNELYKEAAKKYGIDIKDTLALEEAMAEDFRKYTQSREYSGRTLTQKIGDFFRRLYNYFRYNLLGTGAIDEFFDSINTGRYKHSQYTPTGFDAKKRFEGLTYVEQNNRILNITNGMSNVVDRLMLEEENVNKSRVDVIKEVGVQKVAEMAVNDLYKYALDNSETLSEYQIDQVITMLSGFMNLKTNPDGSLVETENGDVVPEGTIGFLGKKAIKKFALTEKLRIDLESTQINGIDPLTEQEVLEANEEIDRKEHWMLTATEQARRDKIGSEIKSMLSRIIKKDSKGNPIKDDVGLDSYLDFNESFATLLRELSGSTSSVEMIEILNVVTTAMPEYRDVYNKLIGDKLLKTKFWVAMQNVHSNFKILIQQHEGMDKHLPVEKRRKIFKWMEANRQSITTSILDDWRQNFNNSSTSKVAEAKAKFMLSENKTAMSNPTFKNWAERWINRIENNKRFAKGTADTTYYNNIEEFHKLTRALGFDITIDELNKLKENKFMDSRSGTEQNAYNLLVSNVGYIYEDLIKGIDIVSGEVGADGKGGASNTIKKIARSISMVRPDMMESSHRSGENKTVYSHILMGFLPKFIHRLKKGNTEVKRLLNIPGLNELPWLRDLLNESDRTALEFAIFDSTKMIGEQEGTVYNKLTPTQLNTTRLHSFFNNGDKKYAFYMVPVLGDASVSMYIKARRLNNSDAVDAAYLTLRSEWAFMKEADKVSNVKNLGENGGKFALFSELNSNPKVVELLKERDKALATKNESLVAELNKELKSILSNYMDSKVTETLKELKKQEILEGLDYRILQEANKEEDTTDFTKFSSPEEFVKNYVYNNVVAKANILTLFVGTPAAYKNTEDIYKRLKEIWSPGTRIDTKATFTLTPEQMAVEGTTDSVISVGDSYVGKIVKDVEERSVKQLGEDTLAIHLAKGRGYEAYAIAAKMGYTNHTLSDGTEVAVPVDKDGKLLLEEIVNKDGNKEIVPVMHFKTSSHNLTDGQTLVSPRRMRKILVGLGRWTSDIQNEFANFLKGKRNNLSLNPLKPFVFGFRDVNGLRLPYQVKNSETMLDPSVSFYTKDGKVELPTVEDRNNKYEKYMSPLLAETLDFMERYSYGDRNYQDFVHFNSAIKVGEYGVGDITNLENAPEHILSNDDYMIISEVGDHFTDDVGNFGTQIRKLAIADLSDSAKFNILGAKTKEDIVNLYHSIIETDVRESFDKVENHFPKALPKEFTTEDVNEYNKKVKELSNRLINEANDRNLGSEAIYALETYKDKDGIERFNIPLFDPIQASRTEALLGSLYRNNVVKQKINGGNLVMVSSVGMSDSLNVVWNADKTAVEYLETRVPHWWKEQIESIIDPETGIVDVNKIKDKSILEIIGYRIPTEDKYSMLPLKIVGFLPRSAGGIIILPREITTLSGADFDIDKLYVMFPNFRTVRNWDFDKLAQEVRELGYSVDKSYVKKLMLDSYKDDTVFTGRDLEIYNVINLLPDVVVDRVSKPLDIKIIKYDSTKSPQENSKKARDNAKMDIIRAILTNPDVTDKLLDPGNFEYITTLSKEIKRKKKYSANLDILDPTTDTKMFEAAMAATGLIGVFANQNINHSIFQHGKVNLKEPIQFGNKTYDSLSQMYAEDVNLSNVPEDLKKSVVFEPKRISRKLSMLLSAIVDDLKHLNSGPLNINFFTADVLSTMVRFGEDMNTALAFINQPAIIRLQELNQKYGNTFEGFDEALKKVKEEYRVGVNKSSNELLTLDNLWEAIGKEGAQDTKFDELQVVVLEKFEQLRDISFDLGRWVRAFRSDNIKRKVNLASNEVFKRNVDKAMDSTTFTGVKELWNNYPMLKAFYDSAVTGASTTLNRFFLYNSPLFTNIKDKISTNLVGRKELTETNIANVNFEIMGTLMNQFDFFKGDTLLEDGKTTVRENILNTFPKEFEDFLIQNPQFKAGYKIARQLRRFEKNAGIPIDTLRFRSTGSLTDVDKAEISESWKQLLYYKESDNMEFNDKVRKLGENLVKYSFFAYGFHMTPDSFSQYIPLEWRKRLRTTDGTTTFNEFLESLFDMSKNIEEIIDGEKVSTEQRIIFPGLYEQFKQHYAANKFFVQRWEAKSTEELNKAIESGKLKLDKAGNPVELNLHVNSDSTMVLEKRNTYGVGNEGRFSDYVSIEYKDKIYLFRADNVDGIGSDTPFVKQQTYNAIPTLGVKRFAKEYTPNATNKKSAFEFNNVSTEPAIFKPVIETTEVATQQDVISEIDFQEEPTSGYKNRTIKNASADATIAIAVDFNSAGEKLTKSSVLNQGKKYIPLNGNDLTVTQGRVDKIVNELNSINSSIKPTSAKGKMTFSYGNNKRNDVKSNTTLEAIKNGERTATTRYESDGHIDYWKKLKTGDIIEWEGKGGEKVLVEVTNPLHKLVGSGKTPQQWSKLEGWSVDYFNSKVKPKINEAWQIEYKLPTNKGISLNIAGNGIYTMNGKYTQQQVDDYTYELLKAIIESPNLKNKITSIRTGGQTGFDEAGAKAGIKLGIPTTILAPKGWTFRDITGKDISNEQQFKTRFTTQQTPVQLQTATKEQTQDKENNNIFSKDEIEAIEGNYIDIDNLSVKQLENIKSPLISQVVSLRKEMKSASIFRKADIQIKAMDFLIKNQKELIKELQDFIKETNNLRKSTQQTPALETTEKTSTFVKPDDVSQESWDRLNNEQKQRLIDC